MRYRIFILLAVILSVFSATISLVAEADGQNTAIGTESRSFVELLLDKTVDEKDDETVSRKAFIELLTDIMKVYDIEVVESAFSDVKRESDLSGRIYAALDLGWISKSDKFRPDDNITLYEALSILVKAIGYSTEADMSGGYPTGFYYTASRLDILDGVGKSGDEELTYGDVFLMTENFLNAEFKSKEYKNGVWTRTTDTTILSKLYNIRKTEGIVTSIDYDYNTSFENGEEILNIGINGNIYLCEAKDEDFIGYSVKAYIRQDDDTVVYIVKTNKNTERTVLRKNIETDGEDVRIYDEEKGKSSKIRLERAFDLYYNSKAVTSEKRSYLEGKSGKITFLDNDRDGTFEVVFLEDYKYITVKSINFSTQELIVDEAGARNAIDLSKVENDYTKVITSDGEALLKDIPEGEILAAALSEDNQRIKLYLCDRQIKEYLSSYDTSAGELYIGDTLYTASQYFTDKFGSAVYPGKEYIFTIGIDENIVSAEFVSEMSYGYLMKIYKDDISDDVFCRIFTDQGKFVRVKCSDKVKIDRKSVKSSEDAVIKAVCGNEAFSAQLIRFKYNKSGEISEIDTASSSMPDYLGQPQPENDKLTRYNADGAITGYTFRSEIKIFYPAFNASASTVFVIPKNGAEENYYVTDSSVFVNDKVYTNKEIVPYDVGADGVAGAVVYNYDISSLKLDSSSTMVFVEEAEYIDENDDRYRKITGWSNGNFKTIYVSADNDIEDGGKKFSVGDILRYKELNGSIMRVVLDFDASEDVFAATGIASDSYFNERVKYASLQFQVGKVYSYKNGFIYLSSQKDADGNYDFSYENLRNFGCDTDSIVLVDRVHKTVVPGTKADIRGYIDSDDEASMVVLVQSYLRTNQVIIYVE